MRSNVQPPAVTIDVSGTFVTVHCGVPPAVSAMSWQSSASGVQPGGESTSVTSHVAPDAKPSTVNSAGLPGDAVSVAGSTFPLVHSSSTVTGVVVVPSEYALFTVTVAVR